MPAWRNSRATVSEGWAPFASHVLALSASTHELDRLAARVVVTERLEGAAVAGAAPVGDDDAVRRLLVRADARQSDADCHGCCVPPLGSGVRAGSGVPGSRAT